MYVLVKNYKHKFIVCKYVYSCTCVCKYVGLHLDT